MMKFQFNLPWRKTPHIPTQSAHGEPYRWPNGDLFYTQGDGITCSKCNYNNTAIATQCIHCQSALGNFQPRKHDA